MAIIKGGLIQMGLKGETTWEPSRIREAMMEAHVALIEDAAAKGVKLICFQEIFNQPYFCPSEDPKWFAAAEKVPDGPTVRELSALAARHAMVIVAPVYELGDDGKYYNTAAVIDADGRFLGKYRKTHIPNLGRYHGKFPITEQNHFTPGDLGYPVFETAYARVGIYICYDRHFPEGWRALGLAGAEVVLNPSATWVGLSRHLWELEQPAAAVANGFFVGAINRVGFEEPWSLGQFYGASYFCDPRGQVLAQGGDGDELVTADLDLDLIAEVQDTWKFMRHRTPGNYGTLVRG